jgi:hypothetical protein
VANFKTSRFRKPAPRRCSTFPFSFDAVARIRHVLRSRVIGRLLCARRAIRPFLCMRMCQLRPVHQQGFESDIPKRIFSVLSSSGGIFRSKCSVPSLLQIGDHESRYEQRSHFLARPVVGGIDLNFTVRSISYENATCWWFGSLIAFHAR